MGERGALSSRLTRERAQIPVEKTAFLLKRIETLCGIVRRGFLQSELKSYRVMQRTLASL